MRFNLIIRLQRRKKPPLEQRWFYLWRNSGVAMEHHGMPSYLRYEGRRWNLWLHWGASRNVRKPTTVTEWVSGKGWPKRRSVKLRA
jgi:hypothetical protein